MHSGLKASWVFFLEEQSTSTAPFVKAKLTICEWFEAGTPSHHPIMGAYMTLPHIGEV